MRLMSDKIKQSLTSEPFHLLAGLVCPCELLRHRLAVVLRYIEGMPIRDIAATLECSEGVVKNILFRSLKKMRDHVAASAEIPT